MGQASTTAKLCCIKTEQELQNIVGGIHPGMVETETFGTANAILDSEGQGIIEKVQTPSRFGKEKPASGTSREVDVKFLLPSCAAATNPDIDFTACADVAGAEESYGYDEAQVDDYVSYQFAIDSYLYDDTCEDPLKELAIKMKTAYRTMFKSFNDKLNSDLLAACGNYYANSADTPEPSLTTPATLNLFTATAPIQPQPMGLFPIIHQYERMGVGGITPIAIGSSAKLHAFDMSRSIYMGNTDGYDSSKAFGVKFVRDYQLDVVGDTDVVAGTQRLVTFIPGTVSILDWYNFEGDIKAITPEGRNVYAPVQASGLLVRQKVDLGSVFGGREWVVDMEIRYDECANKVIYKFRKDFGFWRIPDAAFQTACNQHHNYILLWDLDCGDLACADLDAPVYTGV